MSVKIGINGFGRIGNLAFQFICIILGRFSFFWNFFIFFQKGIALCQFLCYNNFSSEQEHSNLKIS